MKRDFTKNQILKSLMILAFAITTSSLMAQFKMIVNSPSSVEGEYEVQLAAFGNQSSDFVTGDVVLVDDGSMEDADGGQTGSVNDGCQAFTGTTGMVAFIDRGSCAFTEKCLNADADGAIAVVICNNVADAIISMTGDVDISIPCYMTSMADCDALKIEIANGLNVSLGFECDLSGVTYPDNVIFGALPGEGDFDGGLNNWTVDRGWAWDARGGSKGAYSSHIVGQTPTFCNGAMVFDSDYLDNNGVQGDFGAGECPAPCFGNLTSPVIDLTDVVDGVILQFSQDMRQFQSDYFILFSKDGGLSYYDTVQINQSHQTNEAIAYNETIRIPVCGVAGESNFRFRFSNEANYYFWTIDDVMLLDEAYAQGEIGTNWVARYPNYMTPVDHVEAMPFMADVINPGNRSFDDATLSVKVTGPSGELYTASLLYDELIGCSSIENIIFEEMYQVPKEEGTYTVEYSFVSASGLFPEDVFTYDFIVGGSTFSKADWNNSDIGGWRSGNWDGFVTIANVYRTKEFSTPHKALSTTFSISANISDFPNYSGFANSAIYKWVDVNSNNFAEATERIKIAYNFTFFDASQERYDVEFEGYNGEEDLILEDNTTYIVALHINPSDNEAFFVQSVNDADFNDLNYQATGFAYEGLGEPAAQMLLGIGTENSEDDEDSRDFDDGIGLVPVLPLIMQEIETGTEDINKNISVSVYPNPASDVVGITLDLNEVSKNVSIEVVSLDGTVVSITNYTNVKNNTLDLNVTSLANGVYLANIRTNEGFISKRIVVQK